VLAQVRSGFVSLLVCAVAGPAVLYCIAVLTRVQGSISARVRDMPERLQDFSESQQYPLLFDYQREVHVLVVPPRGC
jgi:hypothetical protein